MYYAIEALTYLFDMGIIIIYMNGIFHKENRRTACNTVSLAPV